MIFSEVQDLLKDHHEEVDLHRDKIPMDPDWETYFRLDEAGKFRVYTARDEGLLVGYTWFVVTKGLHYKGNIFALNDLIYIKPEYRGEKIGYGMLKFSEEMLSLEGVSVIQVNSKFTKPFDGLLSGMGYEPIETAHSKILGG